MLVVLGVGRSKEQSFADGSCFTRDLDSIRHQPSRLVPTPDHLSQRNCTAKVLVWSVFCPRQLIGFQSRLLQCILILSCQEEESTREQGSIVHVTK